METQSQSYKLDNLQIHDAPIDYFEIKKEYFEGANVDEITITPNEEGYISDQLTDIVTSRDSNAIETIIINAGVGQGKSTFAISVVKHFLSLGNKVIIAAPFIALIDKYYEEVVSELGNIENAVRLTELTKDVADAELQSYFSKDVLITTTHFLFRDGGDLDQAKFKRDFNNGLINHCQNSNQKVVIIFDEIHKGIDNFDRAKIFEYSKIASIISKQLFLSATYNFPTVAAIKFLSQATNKNVYIINSERLRVSNKNSELHLVFIDSDYSERKVYPFKNFRTKIIEPAIQKGETVNILVWSKKLSNGIAKHWGDMFTKYSIEPNICNADSENKFDTNRKFNIGTLFTTGINIKEGIFVIILPPKYRLTEGYQYGLFSEGAESIIQSIARMRATGKIYIILSKPDSYIHDENRNYFEQLHRINYFSNVVKKDELLLHNDQITKFENKYRGLYREAHSNNVFSESMTFAGVNFPTFEEWVLEKGRGYYKLFSSFGNKLVPYIMYCAFMNQFENCTLKSIIYYDEVFLLRSQTIFEDISAVYSSKFVTPFGNAIDTSILFDNYLNESNIVNDDITAFQYLYTTLLESRIFLDGSIVKNKKPIIIKAILRYLGGHKKGMDIIEYTEIQYFNHQIGAALLFDTMPKLDDVEYKNYESIIACYKALGELKNDFYNSVILQNDMRIFAEPNVNIGFADFYIRNIGMIVRISNFLYKQDKFVFYKVFSFLRPTGNPPSQKAVLDRFRTLFLNFENRDLRIEINESRVRYFRVLNLIETPQSIQNLLNLIFPYLEDEKNYINYSDFLSETDIQELYEEQQGSISKHNFI